MIHNKENDAKCFTDMFHEEGYYISSSKPATQVMNMITKRGAALLSDPPLGVPLAPVLFAPAPIVPVGAVDADGTTTALVPSPPVLLGPAPVVPVGAVDTKGTVLDPTCKFPDASKLTSVPPIVIPDPPASTVALPIRTSLASAVMTCPATVRTVVIGDWLGAVARAEVVAPPLSGSPDGGSGYAVPLIEMAGTMVDPPFAKPPFRAVNIRPPMSILDVVGVGAF